MKSVVDILKVQGVVFNIFNLKPGLGIPTIIFFIVIDCPTHSFILFTMNIKIILLNCDKNHNVVSEPNYFLHIVYTIKKF